MQSLHLKLEGARHPYLLPVGSTQNSPGQNSENNLVLNGVQTLHSNDLSKPLFLLQGQQFFSIDNVAQGFFLPQYSHRGNEEIRDSNCQGVVQGPFSSLSSFPSRYLEEKARSHLMLSYLSLQK